MTEYLYLVFRSYSNLIRTLSHPFVFYRVHTIQATIISIRNDVRKDVAAASDVSSLWSDSFLVACLRLQMPLLNVCCVRGCAK